MSNCIFCRIIKREVESDIVFENEQVVVIRDVNPKAAIHLLIIPKIHIASLAEKIEEDGEIYKDLLKTCQKVAEEQDLDRAGFRVVINTGPDAGQVVDHLHLHILGGEQLPESP